MNNIDSLAAPREVSPLAFESIRLAKSTRKLCHQIISRDTVDRPIVMQLLRSSTSVGANIREARYAESRKDCIHKLKIAEKELAETFYWLGVLASEPNALPCDTAEIEQSSTHVKKLLASMILQMKRKANDEK